MSLLSRLCLRAHAQMWHSRPRLCEPADTAEGGCATERRTVRAANQLPKSAALLGLAFDNEDGHTRLTRGKNPFCWWEGAQETHAVMQETAVKINEHLDKRSIRLEDVPVGELRKICRDVVESIRPS